jgi:hypothetical protein
MTLVFRSVVRSQRGCHFSRSLCILPERYLTTCRLISSSTSTPSSDANSVKSKFKETPVNPSILQYIERIGIGIPPKKKRRASRPGSHVLSQQEEQEQFQRIRRLPSTSPPPPFAARSDEKTDSGKRIERFPVKLLGSVGSSDEEFPRATSGLPEVVSLERKPRGHN